MRIAVCYSGQLRLARFVIDSHLIYLYRHLKSSYADVILDTFLITNDYDTSRVRINASEYKFNWVRSEYTDNHRIEYIKRRLSLVSDSLKVVISSKYLENTSDYSANLREQLRKMVSVLELASSSTLDYDYIIRLRPDCYFMGPVILPCEVGNDIVIQNYENANVNNGDAIQIFEGKHLNKLLEQLNKVLYNNGSLDGVPYEYLLNSVLSSSGLNIRYEGAMFSRWIDKQTVDFAGANWRYVNDWKSLEYQMGACPPGEHVKDPRRGSSGNTPKYKNKHLVAGLIPCAGTASRIHGIPKFLLPCASSILIDHTISHMTNAGLDDIYAGVSSNNAPFFTNRKQMLDVVDMPQNTKTMSETISFMLQSVSAFNYMLFMPDTWFKLSSSKIQECMRLLILGKVEMVVILWLIRPEQYGKLGQCLIEGDLVVDVRDKDSQCKYPYSWGVIGWNESCNTLLDVETPHVGYMLNAALNTGKKIGAVLADDDSIYYDCGTPEEYFQMVKIEC